jgi:hypothetical protein
MQQQDPEKKPEGQEKAQPMEGMVGGGELKEEKSELQKIIDRNKSQLEESVGEDKAAEVDFSEKKTLPDGLESSVNQAQERIMEIEEIAEKNKELVENLDRKITKEENINKLVSREKKEEILQNLEKELKEEGISTDDDDDDGDEDSSNIQKHAQGVLKINDPQRQIERLVQLAVNRNPGFAIKVAKHLDDNYILDQVHDRLVEDKVRDELIKKGLLEEI